MPRARIVSTTLVAATVVVVGSLLVFRGGVFLKGDAGAEKGHVEAAISGKTADRKSASSKTAPRPQDSESLTPFGKRKVTRADVKAFLDARGRSEANLYIARYIFGYDQKSGENAFAMRDSSLSLALQELQQSAREGHRGEIERIRKHDPNNSFADLLEMRAAVHGVEEGEVESGALLDRVMRAVEKKSFDSESRAREAALIDFWKFHAGNAKEGWIAAMEEGYSPEILLEVSRIAHAREDAAIASALAEAVMMQPDEAARDAAAKQVREFARMIGEDDSVRRNGGLGLRIDRALQQLLAPSSDGNETGAPVDGPVPQDTLSNSSEMELARRQTDQLFLAALKFAPPDKVEWMESIYRERGILEAQRSLALAVGVAFPLYSDPLRPGDMQMVFPVDPHAEIHLLPTE